MASLAVFFSVVVDNFDLVGISVSPFEADSVLLIDANAVLPCSIPTQCLKTIAR